ncbi:MAG: dihydrodipicolinate reductase C-terminal domain-containing protein [Planctomycetota bacterium]
MTTVLVSGLPGAMAAEVATLVSQQSDLSLAGVGLTSEKHAGGTLSFGEQTVRLVEPARLGADDLPPDAVAVDYSTPDAALDNVRWFAERSLPMVIGTTGFGTDEAKSIVDRHNGLAVIAPNMAVPIVLLQAAARFLAEQFPGALAGGELSIRESHQAGKRDTSGTAKALVVAAQALGFDYDVGQIESVRDPQTQRGELGVPDEHLAGHALHQYDARLADGTVQLVLEHNVLGRRVYAEGTLKAARFLASRGGSSGVFDMEDVLRG